jgi:hypothetical protein
MYFGLFLTPWMLMYAISTVAMNHRPWVSSLYATKDPAWRTERELEYMRSFPPETAREQVAKGILQDLGLDGTHSVSGGRNDKPLVVTRLHPLGQERITFDPAAKKIVIQREELRGQTFLERMHRRRGYQHPYALERSWAFSVDLAVVAMMFWSLSGLWLWWELKPTRVWGALCAGIGITAFALFVILL